MDSSGLRVVYTPTLRKEDVGIMFVGMIEGFAIPPKPDNFRLVGFCDSSCTKEVTRKQKSFDA